MHKTSMTSRIHKEQAGIRSIDLKFGDPSHLAVQFADFFPTNLENHILDDHLSY